ncbi:hypothetical protein MNBD_GAMMA26-1554 [hydrothermal vent metagenome]|uniref:Flagellar biosynthesis protein FlgN n=1 Tax=hydrothermal vent metagenome TaxID=652676 RepID=A0A3B1B582_9ZZZZ
MPITIDQQKHLFRLLSAELKDSQCLLDILLEEHHGLGCADPDQIASICTKKISRLRMIETHVEKRKLFLSFIKFSPDQAGIKSIIQLLPANNPVAVVWSQLQDLTKKLQHQNEINGGIITLTKRHLTTALDILTGKINTASTYGRQGQANTGHIPHRLAKA